MIQNIAISVLVLHYSGKQSAAAVFVAGLATSAVGLFSDNLVDMKSLSYLQAGAGALSVASKLPQILAVWQEGGTGQLSAFAVSISHLITTYFANYHALGIQLSRWISISNLYYSPRSG